MSATARRRPGPAPSFTRQQVVQAALDVMAEEGLNAVSFRNVSKRLGVNPMALYTYVRDKDELLAAMFDSVSGSVAVDLESTAPAVEQLVEYYVRARSIYLRNAELYRLVRRGGLADVDLRTAERLFELLLEAGVPEGDLLTTQMTLLQLTIGNALYWSSAASDGSDRIPAALVEAFTALDAERFPHLVATGARIAEMTGEDEFTAAVRRVIGCAALPAQNEAPA